MCIRHVTIAWNNGYCIKHTQFHSFILRMCSPELNQQEVYGLSCILRRLATNFSVQQFGGVGSAQVEALVQLLKQLACLCTQKTVQEEVSHGK